MKKLFSSLIALLLSIVCSAQTDSISTSIDTIKQPTIDERLDNIEQRLEILDIDLSLKQRYKLYPTENMYTFLLLDTKTGRIDKVQWNLDTEKEFITTINDADLTYGMGYGSGSFELYPTQNLYQFLLIDKTSGRTWHVQWGMEKSKRWIRRIYY